MGILKKPVFKGFMMGIVFSIVISIGIGSVYAKSKNMNISVLMGGIKVYVDDHLQVFKDVNGKVVEPMIYNGTTYLPVRGVANAVGKEVHWDQKTMTVSLGQKAVVGQIDIAEIDEYYDYDNPDYGIFLTNADANFQKLNKEVQAFNRIEYNQQFHYVLDSKYSVLKAKLDVPYTGIYDDIETYVKFYSIDRFGSETEIAHYETRSGNNPVDVHVNLHGVEILRIDTHYKSALYNITLGGMK